MFEDYCKTTIPLCLCAGKILALGPRSTSVRLGPGSQIPHLVSRWWCDDSKMNFWRDTWQNMWGGGRGVSETPCTFIMISLALPWATASGLMIATVMDLVAATAVRAVGGMSNIQWWQLTTVAVLKTWAALLSMQGLRNECIIFTAPILLSPSSEWWWVHCSFISSPSVRSLSTTWKAH